MGGYTNCMRNKYLDQLKTLVLEQMNKEPVRVILFGSRARGDYHLGSDVDIGLIPLGQLKSARISLLKEKIENSCIPYKVDLVDLKEASQEFVDQALKDAIIWKN